MAENSEANECNKYVKMKKDNIYNLHERMHVCMCARMCVAACGLKVFASLCADLQVPTRIHVFSDSPLSCSCPAKEDSNSDVHACVHASSACMCLCM